MRRFLISLGAFFLVLLGSCASLSPNLSEVMQSWVGSPLTPLTASWGWPTETAPSGLCDGCIAAVYVKPSATMTSSKKPSSAQHKLAEGNFDLTVTALPPHFRGNSFRPVYNRAVIVAPKGEFETTEEYEKRAARHIEGVYAFVASMTGVNYDADTEKITIAAKEIPVSVGLTKSVLKGILVGISTIESDYAAANAFGAKTTVHRSSSEIEAVVPNQATAVPSFAFQVARSDAPHIKPALRALLICTIEPEQESAYSSGDFNGFSSSAPTFDNPFEYFWSYYFLKVELRDVWVFDERSGRILARLAGTLN